MTSKEETAVSDENRRLFEALRDHLNAIDLSNSEQYDKAILTLSSSGLALSIAITRFAVPIEKAACLWLMIMSWPLFLLAIVSTIVSFLFTKSAINDTQIYGYEYYINGNEECGAKTSPWSNWVHRSNIISGASFIAGITSIVLFMSINIAKPEWVMKKENTSQSSEQTEKKGYVPSTVQSQGPRAKPTSSSGSSGSGGSQQSSDKK